MHKYYNIILFMQILRVRMLQNFRSRTIKHRPKPLKGLTISTYNYILFFQVLRLPQKKPLKFLVDY
ncbi:hypothetical protein PEPS_34770 (plasmid) [Persicobacter psychrovividus]|uniref:Uncharacterized protein n=1 Tax=Persicobacter psychrovividus TaxID=387638 RepID=A0ABM7VK15_9BACT|nr:hypothetical protein PEPS_34770 [Persicobacter psychrovividus]